MNHNAKQTVLTMGFFFGILNVYPLTWRSIPLKFSFLDEVLH